MANIDRVEFGLKFVYCYNNFVYYSIGEILLISSRDTATKLILWRTKVIP